MGKGLLFSTGFGILMYLIYRYWVGRGNQDYSIEGNFDYVCVFEDWDHELDPNHYGGRLCDCSGELIWIPWHINKPQDDGGYEST
jgi:hypothetical protein